MSLAFQGGPAGTPRADEPPPRRLPRYYSLKSNMNLCAYYTTPGALVKYFRKNFSRQQGTGDADCRASVRTGSQ